MNPESRKNTLVVSALCTASFTIGLLITPISNVLKKVEWTQLTDSTFIYSSNIEELRLHTPSDGYHIWNSPKGNLYMGVWKDHDLRNGVIITEKSVYEGEIKNLAPHGYGVMYYNNGNVYRGNWIVGNKEGIGLKQNRDGAMFFGHWRAGLLNAPPNAHYNVEDYVYGIDLSHHQSPKNINWNQLALISNKNGEVYSHKTKEKKYMHPVTFALIRATCYDKRDSCYFQHIENAKKHNVIVGSYHFFSIDNDIDDQINIFINTVKYEKGDLPPILDLENETSKKPSEYERKLRRYGVSKMQEDALKWLRAIEQHYKVKPIIYTSESWKKNFLNDKRFEKYDFWYARYYNIRPKKENNWILWQRTDLAVANGYDKVLDVDMFNGNYADFIKRRSGCFQY